MKKLILGLTLLTLTNASHASQPSIRLESALLSLVDGTEFIGIGEIFKFAGINIFGILHGLPIKTALELQEAYHLDFPESLENHVNEKGRVGLIWFKDGYINLKQLIKLEQENLDDPALQNDVKHALINACNHFEKLSEDYVVEIEASKDIMVKIIANWSRLRNRPDSLLLAWSKFNPEDKEAMLRTMTSVKVFDTFLDDLLLFLKDLIQNCPKSHKMYREQCQDTKLKQQ